MKAILILIVGIVMTMSLLLPVQAETSQNSAEQDGVQQTGAGSYEDSGIDRKAWSKSLFEGRCQMCHQLPEPSMLNPKQWRLVLSTMQHRMEQFGVPPLTEEETEMLIEYLAEQSR